jgi:hypothetical protein
MVSSWLVRDAVPRSVPDARDAGAPPSSGVLTIRGRPLVALQILRKKDVEPVSTAVPFDA